LSLPGTTALRQTDTHRLIPSRYSEGGESVLTRVAGDADLDAVFDLDNATNDRLRAENALLPEIGIHELVFGVPNFRIINASFCHAHPLGSRFNAPDRGQWYAAFELETAQAEVAFHKWLELAEIDRTDEAVTYDDYLADFSAELHDVRRGASFRDCLDPESYRASQALAERLLRAGSLGIVYPSVRKPGGTCLACFRPALVGNVRRSHTYVFQWQGSATPEIARA
jgi:hypothetical protein